jgi:hypothetical protein
MLIGLVAVVACAADLPAPAAGYMTLCLHDDFVQRPVELAGVEACKALKPYLVVNTYCQSDAMYQDRLKDACPQIPAAVAQDPTGKVIWKESGGTFPSTAPTWSDVADRIRNKCKGDKCKGGQCDTDTKPKPIGTTVNNTINQIPVSVPIEAVKPEAPKPEAEFPWLLLLGVLIVTAVVAVAVSFRREVASAE